MTQTADWVPDWLRELWAPRIAAEREVVAAAPVSGNKPVYYLWTYSPTSGDVTLSHTKDSPHHKHDTHQDHKRVRVENDLIHGFAWRIANGWRIFDDDAKALEDRHAVEAVRDAILAAEGELREALPQYSDPPKGKVSKTHYGSPAS